MIGVGVGLAQFRELVLTLCRILREGHVCLLRGLAAATFSAASGKAPALLQTRQMLWNHCAALMVSSCRKPSAQNVLQVRPTIAHATSSPVLLFAAMPPKCSFRSAGRLPARP